MKNILTISILIFLVACGEKNSVEEKRKRLNELEKQQTEITNEIRTLRSELGIKEQGRTKNVIVTPVKDTTFISSINIQGSVKGEKDVMISAEMPGTITRVLVEAGAEVSEGQVLAELDNQVILQGISEVRTQRDFAANVFQKQKNLWDEKIGTELQYLQAKNNLEALDKRLATLNEQLDMSRIKAPIRGTVDAVNVKVGQQVAPGVPAFNVVDATKLKVIAEVPEVYLGRFKKGSKVVIEFPHRKDHPGVNATITHASKSINPLNRTFNIEIMLNEKDVAVLGPNMIAVVKLIEKEIQNAIVVPSSVLQKDDLNGTFLYVAEKQDNKEVARLRKVKVGSISGNKAHIESGLAEGDRVITVGYQGLANNEALKF